MDDSFGNCQENRIGPNGKESAIMQYLTSHDTVDDMGKRATKEVVQEMGKNENVQCPDLTLFPRNLSRYNFVNINTLDS